MVAVSVLISVLSISISLVGLVFAVLSWRETNRPIIIARVTTASGGNINTLLNLVIENTGNRPAKDIRLIAKLEDVKQCMSDKNKEIPMDAQRCFFSNVSIPVLANGKLISNAFWFLGSSDDAWLPNSKIPLTIEYSDLRNRKFSEKIELLIADDAGFAQTIWETDKN